MSFTQILRQLEQAKLLPDNEMRARIEWLIRAMNHSLEDEADFLAAQDKEVQGMDRGVYA